MNKYACQYALLRFKPYVETGEFANVGVVLVVPETGLFKYKLQKKYARLTQFFHGLNGAIYLEARRQFEQELERFGNFYTRTEKRLNNAYLFAEFAHPKEGILQFDELRSVLTEDPTKKLNELFGHYCEHDFANKEYVEKLMERSVKTLLRNAELDGLYKTGKVGNEDLRVNFPFVRQNIKGIPDRIIKPLNLDQEDASKILLHGGQWVDRIRRLRKRNLLPENVLVPVKEPLRGLRHHRAYEEIRSDLAQLDIEVVQVDERHRIISFAA